MFYNPIKYHWHPTCEFCGVTGFCNKFKRTSKAGYALFAAMLVLGIPTCGVTWLFCWAPLITLYDTHFECKSCGKSKLM